MDSDPGFRSIVETTLSDVPPPPDPGPLRSSFPSAPSPVASSSRSRWDVCQEGVDTFRHQDGVSLYLPFMLWGEGHPPGSRGRLVQTS